MKAYKLIVLLLITCNLAFGDQQKLDSVELNATREVNSEIANVSIQVSTLKDSIRYFKSRQDTLNWSAKMQQLAFLYEETDETENALSLYKHAMELSASNGDHEGVISCLERISFIQENRGYYFKAIQSCKRGLDEAEEYGYTDKAAFFLRRIAYIYLFQDQWHAALEYISRSEKLFRKLDNDYALIYCLAIKGQIFNKTAEYAKAQAALNEGYAIVETSSRANDPSFLYVTNGQTYEGQGNYSKALEFYEKSLAIKWERGSKWEISNVSSILGNLYISQGNFDSAIQYCESALLVAIEGNHIEIKRNACHCLYRAKKAMGEIGEALSYYEQMNLYNDSMRNDEALLQLQEMEFQNQVKADSIAQEEQKIKMRIAHELEVSEKENARNISIGAVLILFIISLGLYTRSQYIRKAKNRIEEEKQRSDNLLLNILPADIAAELKENGKAQARDFDKVSILFTDFKGFTEQSAKLSAADLVDEINHCFEAFDAIIDRYNVEKIKTIGDAYMAAGGIPADSKDSAKNTVLAALDMQEFIAKRKLEREAKGQTAFQMRVGIHTGPVVAGIVGVKKFQYDIWGDAVNTASRIESAGEVGRVNISKTTYEMLEKNPDFAFESRGKIEAKGKGELEMYFVSKTQRKTV